MHVRKSLLALCLALLITTAGCNALGDGSETTTTPEATTTTAETTTTTTEMTTEITTTTTRNATSYPPGIAENGTVMNASALANAHHQLLIERGAVWQANRTSTESGYYNVSYEQRIATGGDSLYRDRDTLPTSERYTYWANESLLLYREQAENGTIAYSSERIGAGGLPEQSGLMERATQKKRIYHPINNSDQTTIVETKVIDEVRYTTVRVVEQGENASITMTFNASGLGVVHSYELTSPAPGPFNGTVTRSYELTKIGDVTVDRPDWTSEALNETND